MSHPVDDDPLMASAIGRCSNNWTHVETTLTYIFSSLTQTEPTIAVTVFSFFKATNTQIAVLKKLAKMASFMTIDLRDRLTKNLKIYEKLAERRNQLLHNPIGRSIEHQTYIMLRHPAPRSGEVPYEAKPISPSEIDELSTNITALVFNFIELQKSIDRARHPNLTDKIFFPTD